MSTLNQPTNFNTKKEMLLKLLPELECYECHEVPTPGNLFLKKEHPSFEQKKISQFNPPEILRVV